MHGRLSLIRFPSFFVAVVFALAASLILGGVLGYTMKPRVSVPNGAQALAAETKTFTGVKNCSTAVTISPPKPGGYCLITESSLKILEGSSVFYIDAQVANHVLISPVTLKAIDERGSTATGQCTYYQAAAYPPGHGLCDYTSGTGKLAGFHATIVVGPPTSPGVFSLMGTYWFDRDIGAA
jgi:hypothetical protein